MVPEVFCAVLSCPYHHLLAVDDVKSFHWLAEFLSHNVVYGRGSTVLNGRVADGVGIVWYEHQRIRRGLLRLAYRNFAVAAEEPVVWVLVVKLVVVCA